MPVVFCSHCNEKPVFARGICQACYYRLRRTGQLTRRNAQNLGLTCRADGCDKPALAKGFCLHHYEHQRHPLNHSWRLLRSRYPGDYPAVWDRFEVFLADVGERPSPKHQLRRLDVSQPWSADNARWAAPITRYPDYYSPEKRSAYSRAHNLARKFNLTPDDYDALLAKQGGVCAICAQVETHKYPSGKPKDLAVDHDHITGKVRGLLCFNCNQGVGRFQNSPERLRCAAAYLEGA